MNGELWIPGNRSLINLNLASQYLIYSYSLLTFIYLCINLSPLNFVFLFWEDWSKIPCFWKAYSWSKYQLTFMFLGNKITIESVKELLQTVQYQSTLANQLNRVVGIGLLRLSLQVSVYYLQSSNLQRCPVNCLNVQYFSYLHRNQFILAKLFCA